MSGKLSPYFACHRIGPKKCWLPPFPESANPDRGTNFWGGASKIALTTRESTWGKILHLIAQRFSSSHMRAILTYAWAENEEECVRVGIWVCVCLGSVCVCEDVCECIRARICVGVFSAENVLGPNRQWLPVWVVKRVSLMLTTSSLSQWQQNKRKRESQLEKLFLKQKKENKNWL